MTEAHSDHLAFQDARHHDPIYWYPTALRISLSAIDHLCAAQAAHANAQAIQGSVTCNANFDGRRKPCGQGTARLD